LSDAARANAEQICRARGLRPGAGLEQCILDVGETGNASFADAAAVVSQLLRLSVGLGPLASPVEDTVALQLGQRVTGTLGKPFVTDVFQVDLQAGDTIHITTPGACTNPATFAITLVAPSGRPVGRTRGDGCGSLGFTNLRESGQYQLRVFDSGGFTGTYELQVDGVQSGLSCQATDVAPNDDGSGPEVPLPFTLNFFGRQFSSVWVNNNGNVTFDGPLSSFTPQPLDTFGTPTVAAWFADVDTRGANSQPVRFGFGTVDGRRAFCVSYNHVGYFDAHDDKLNSFQLFLVDRSGVAPGAFDIVFQYQQLQWETGDLSGGNGGLGGTSAGVGYTNGRGQPGTFLELPGSRQPGSFLDSSPTGLTHTSTNSTTAGVHVFPIRSS
jgi:Nidogen-like